MVEWTYGLKEIINMNLILVGLGYWGPNLLRTFNNLGVLRAAYDMDAMKLEKFKSDPIYSNVVFDTDWERTIRPEYADAVDGVIIATPPDTHYGIAMKALRAGKHVFIEKPMTLDVAEAEEIVALAKEKKLIVLVGHIFLYSPEILKLKEIVSSEDFGDILYVYTQRLNLGQIQVPANVIEDLAPHDISILNYILEDECEFVLASAQSHVIDGSEDVAFINMKFKKGTTAHLHLSWLDPLKIRNTVVVGSKQMVVCDSGAKKIDIYNKSVDIDERCKVSNLSYARHLMSYKYGDVLSPYIDGAEPMIDEARAFTNSITTGNQPLASGDLGVDVVRVLAAMQRSLKGGQRWERV
jgi:predicted dehydrogenase